MHKYLKDNPSLQKLTIQTEKNNANIGRDDDDYTLQEMQNTFLLIWKTYDRSASKNFKPTWWVPH